ncbi:DUF4124 domain-containing protein [Marichromatium gracile]|uniref:DUF4124 domain-containing protein n=1 Tax=Marichromatium gracile TaxID=1048 RepID=A0ABR5VE75_MARGR|nr:DUF4124 domain-containing protein [Marichromatium gracile]KXX64018.1 hypothetical protein AY586_14920 [Marichromatium gracile]
MHGTAMTLAVVATLWCAAGWAGVYKCTDPDTGAVTFSQVPCAGESERVKVWAASARDTSRPSMEALAEQCVKEGRFKDPASAEIVEIGDMGSKIITYANREIVAQRLPIKVNARNGYGGYGGATWYDCYLSRASNQVFMVVAR